MISNPRGHHAALLVDVVRARAEATPDRDAFVFLRYGSKGEREETRLTYSTLLERASVIAAALQSCAVRGSRALILAPPGLDYITAFLGCQLAAVVAVPAYPPRNAKHMARLNAIVADCAASAVLTTSDLKAKLHAWAGSVLPETICIDRVGAPGAAGQPTPIVGADDLSFLQYTSGTTGDPKGVMVAHSNLVANWISCARSNCTADDVLVSWLPPYHDFGLVGSILQPLFGGFLHVSMAPASFVQEPARWLQAASDFGATTLMGPNFAFEMCCALPDAVFRDLDLSRLRLVVVGGEPVRAQTMERFAERFARAGFDARALTPGWGLAESTLQLTYASDFIPPRFRSFRIAEDGAGFGTVEATEPPGGALRLVSNGPAIAGHDLRVVDPATGYECAAGEIGEVWAAGPTITRGYWERPDLTAATFMNRICGEPGAGPFLRTGDLGALVSGDLYLLGRIKELVVVRGRNIYPQDVEATVASSHPDLGIDSTIAFGVDDGEENLIIVHEVRRSAMRALDAAAVAAAIRGAVIEAHEVDPSAIVFVRPATLPRTTSGKLQRIKTRDLYRSGSLAIIEERRSLKALAPVTSIDRSRAARLFVEALEASAPERRPALLRRYLAERVSEQLGVEVDPEEAVGFASLGVDSMQAVQFGAWLNTEFRLEPPLPASVLFDHPNLALLTALLGERLGWAGTTSSSGVPASPVVVGGGPIAIVGMAARFPGGGGLDGYWDLLRSGRDPVARIPPDRLDLDPFYDPTPGTPGRIYTRDAALLDRVDLFDADFFAISPREAASMDPQQRLLLETAWTALEHALIPPDSLRASQTGVFIGAGPSEYGQVLGRLGAAGLDTYFGTGTAPSVLAGRLAYALGLEGPALTIDTACSSSLVAVHQACVALRGGECDAALAGGVNLILGIQAMLATCGARMLAPDGRCKTFDAAADGYGRAEGVGLVVLKRLADAERDGDRVLAVIRGSAVNADGASGGLTVPNGPAQERLIGQALRQAGVAPGEVAYLETHGTGTALGDPIEVQAAARALGVGRAPDQPLLMGAAKASVGHLEAAAGIAGLIKVVLALGHGELPGQLHFHEPNPHIAWGELPVEVVARNQAWPAGRRVAGVSAFGMSGTNAHLVVEAYDAPRVVPAEAADPAEVAGEWPGETGAAVEASGWPLPGRYLLPLSARAPAALRALASRYVARLDDEAAPLADADLAGLCRSAAVGRSHLPHRAGLAAATRPELVAALSALAAGRPHAGLWTGQRRGAPRVAVLFAGQGGQRAGMGAELYAGQPVFAAVVDRCVAAVDGLGLLAHPLRAVMFAQAGSALAPLIDDTAYAQPALYALEAGLFALWRSWGLEVEAVLGHSLGEYAAAQAAGVLGLEAGAVLVARRGSLMSGLPSGGAMAAVFADAERVAAVLAEVNAEASGAGVSLAAENGTHRVVSGPVGLVERVVAVLSSEGARCQPLAIDYAFHSALLDPVLDAFEQACAEVTYTTSSLPFVSNLTGEVMAGAPSPGYWRSQTREPVRFAQGVATLAGLGVEVLLEVGPRGVLSALALGCWPEGASQGPARAVASLTGSVSDGTALGEAAAQLYAAGCRLAFESMGPAGAGRNAGVAELPAYPFQGQRHWIDAQDEVPAKPPGGLLARLAAGEVDAIAGELSDLKGNGSLRSLLEGLLARHRADEDAGAAASLLYEVAWRAVPTPSAARHDGCWGLVAPEDALSTALIDRLADRGVRCERLKVEAVADRVGDFDAFLYIADTSDAPDDAPDLRDAFRLGKAVAALPRPLHLVTRRAQSIATGAEADIGAAALWGFARGLRSELPATAGRLVDLPDGDASHADLLATALLDAGNERELASRDGRLLAPRLVRRSAPGAAGRAALRRDATYLVTGGLGALGLATAEHMVDVGAGRLLLVGRRAPDAAAALRLESLAQRTACCIETRQVDVTDAAAVAELVGNAGTSEKPLRGIVHAAGWWRAETLADQSWASFRDVFSAKLDGARHLSHSSADLDLDLFVLFSSAAAVLPGPRQVAYAAANAGLDALAASRRALGLAALSVAWGPWSSGMGGGDAAKAFLEKQRILAPLRPATALTALDLLLGHGVVASLVLDADWTALGRAVGSARPTLFEDLVAGDEPGIEEDGATELLLRLRASERPRAELLAHVSAAVTAVLGLREAPDPELGFFDLGMDSLMATELRGRLGQDLGRKLPATVALDHPNITALADYLAPEVLSLAPSPEISLAPVVVGGGPIAIVGMAARFPGGGGLDGYWDLLRSGRDPVAPIPPDRLDLDPFYDPAPGTPGRIYTRDAALLDRVDLFDADFFAISPREAASMDPQQRLLLETAWTALEHALIPPDSLRASQTGVFIGAGPSEYGQVLGRLGAAGLDTYFGTGTAPSVLAGRLAYALGLEGPALTIDTACSSSLVAVHQACVALRGGECDAALAGGVNLILGIQAMLATCGARMLAPDGRCKTFDAAADGYGRAEGVGLVVLKRLADAERDGDRVLAVIRGSAVNADGASGGLTVPNGPAQERLIGQALRQAGVAPGEVAYLETHGTGTALGDPIEVQAAARALGVGRAPDQPLLMGAAKASVGHLEAAAGIAGLIKVVLALGHGELPGQLHFHEPNPHIAWGELPVEVVARNQAWPAGRRVAGVSAFGMSGTNAHLVVEAYDAPRVVPAEAADPAEVAGEWPGETGTAVEASGWPLPGRYLLPLSARAPAALRALASRYVARLDDEAAPLADADLAGLCRSAAVGRSHLPHRAGLAATTRPELVAALSALAAGRPHAGLWTGQRRGAPRVAVLFAGQGGQRVGMGAELYAGQPVFAAVVDRCVAAVDGLGLLAHPLRAVMFAQAGSALAPLIDSAAYAQPALYALEAGLFALWRSWGLEVEAVLGHSLGEYAAAQAAGVLGLEAGAVLVARRGSLMSGLPSGGAMAAVFADAERVAAVLAEVNAEASGAGVSLAAENGTHRVVSGPVGLVERVVAVLSSEGARCQPLAIDYASHSALLDPVLDAFEQACAEVTYAAPSLTLVSCLTSEVMAGAPSPGYWRSQTREPVRFAQGVATLAGLGVEVLLEVGPRGVLSALALGCWPEGASQGPARAVASLTGSVSDGTALGEAAAQLYAAGCRLAFESMGPAGAGRNAGVAELPAYPFQAGATGSMLRRVREPSPACPARSSGSSTPLGPARPPTPRLSRRRPRPGSQITSSSARWCCRALRTAASQRRLTGCRARSSTCSSWRPWHSTRRGGPSTCSWCSSRPRSRARGPSPSIAARPAKAAPGTTIPAAESRLSRP